MDFFLSKKVERPQFNLLAAGEHVVRLIRAEETDSFSQFNGEPKSKETAWKDATPQLAITVVAAEKGKSGGLTHRLNGLGYVKDKDLSDAQRESGDYQIEGGYACTLNEDGILVREVSPDATKACNNILNQFASAIGAKEGENLGDAIQRAIAQETPFRVTIVNDEYQEKEQLRMQRFKAVAAAVPELTE
jgi:hypothetical protein